MWKGLRWGPPFHPTTRPKGGPRVGEVEPFEVINPTVSSRRMKKRLIALTSSTRSER
jgi:hypothetical protein